MKIHKAYKSMIKGAKWNSTAERNNRQKFINLLLGIVVYDSPVILPLPSDNSTENPHLQCVEENEQHSANYETVNVDNVIESTDESDDLNVQCNATSLSSLDDEDDSRLNTYNLYDQENPAHEVDAASTSDSPD